MELRPDTIHAASNHSVGYPAAMVARALNIPFVYEMRGLWALSRAARDEVYRRSDRFGWRWPSSGMLHMQPIMSLPSPMDCEHN